MKEHKNVRFLFDNEGAATFVYRPPNGGSCEARNATLGVKFAQGSRILDDWYLFGGTRWSRALFRLKHPIVYSKRGLRSLWRKIKRRIWGDPPTILCRRYITKEEALKHWPNKKENNGNN